MMHAPRPEPRTDDPPAPASLGLLAAGLVTCTHPESTQVEVLADVATWCAACGALRRPGHAAAWQGPTLIARLTKKHFEDLVLLFHAVVQLSQIARAHASPATTGSPAHLFLRNVRASLAALARLPSVRDVDRLEDAIAAMPPARVRP